MNAIEILKTAPSDGVFLSLNGAGKLRIEGKRDHLKKWLPLLRENKKSLLALLAVRIKSKDQSLIKNDAKLHHTANEWISKNRNNLKAAGFTDFDLFNQGWPKGISNLGIWQKNELTVELHGDRLIFSHTTPSGKIVKQTAKPEITNPARCRD